MVASAPHFVLLAESQSDETQGRWQFVLAPTEGGSQLIASDSEEGVQGERLELLSVLRGLEALDQPSRVTVVTNSRYVRHGLTRGLNEWREMDWCWERFGELVPVKHLDLWLRIDQALKFHQVECRTLRFDAPHRPAGPVQRPTGNEAPQRRDEAAATRKSPPAPKRRPIATPQGKGTGLGERMRSLGERLWRRDAAVTN